MVAALRSAGTGLDVAAAAAEQPRAAATDNAWGRGGGRSVLKQRRSPRERGRTGTRKRAPQRLWARRAREGISPPAAGGDPARTRARASAREREDARTWGPGSRTSSASPAGCGPHGMTCDDDQLLTVHVHVHVLYVYVYSCTRTQTRRPLPWSGRHVRKYGSTKYFRESTFESTKVLSKVSPEVQLHVHVRVGLLRFRAKVQRYVPVNVYLRTVCTVMNPKGSTL